MQYWLTNYLKRYLGGADLSKALTAVTRAYEALGWDDIRKGGSHIGSLSFCEKMALVQLAAHVGHVIEYDVRHGGA
jgi:hypothetical protein